MDSEEEQLQELKRWWQEHGRTVIVGVVLGLGSVIGWTSWQAHVQGQAEAVSALYEQLVNTAARPDHAAAVAQADAIVAQHPDSGYAALAALTGAHSAYSNQDRATARRLLQWAAGNGEVFRVAEVARIRLARLLSEEGEHDAALAEIDQVTDPEFTALSAEVRGDILAARSDAAGARAAYESALAEESLPAGARGRIELKRDALPVAGG